MFLLYNLLIVIIQQLLKIVAFFNSKINLFVNGRKGVFHLLNEKINPEDKTIWFHAASLGEYEQGLPVIEKIKEYYSSYKIILTFFSPSGYEVRKDSIVADIICYLPMDTRNNANKFIQIVRPEMVFFIKYEFWLNYLNVLHCEGIPTYLISGIFRRNQLFFKWYGNFYKRALDAFDCFFVQDDNSRKLLAELGKTNVIVSGDTRFDRVATILQKNNDLDFVASFKNYTTTVVIGSSWSRDEDLFIEFINKTHLNVKFIIVPHDIKSEQIASLKRKITKKTVLFSEKDGKRLSSYSVFIIDTIGILTKIYNYADIAYVGGGFGKPGVHNILEPAVFGIPIIIGPNYDRFAEAVALVKVGGCISISTQRILEDTLNTLILRMDIRKEKGQICRTFVQKNKNATNIILSYIKNENRV